MVPARSPSPAGSTSPRACRAPSSTRTAPSSSAPRVRSLRPRAAPGAARGRRLRTRGADELGAVLVEEGALHALGLVEPAGEADRAGTRNVHGHRDGVARVEHLVNLLARDGEGVLVLTHVLAVSYTHLTLPTNREV